jgi:hypothetical protein
MTKLELENLKQEISDIKEYVNTDLCKKCEEMSNRLKECEEMLNYVQYQGS